MGASCISPAGTAPLLFASVCPQPASAASYTHLDVYKRQAGLSAYLGVTSGEQYGDPDTLHPALSVGGSGEAGKAGEAVQALAAWLQNPPLDDTAALRTFLTERKSALRALYSDPYYYEYSMMLQASTQANRFMDSIPAGFVGSSMSYKDFICLLYTSRCV